MVAGQPICFQTDLVVEGDVLFRMRHFLSSEIRYPVTRFMLNTAFLSGHETVIPLTQLDGAPGIHFPSDFLVKVTHEEIEETSEYSSVLAKIKAEEWMLDDKSSASSSPEKDSKTQRSDSPSRRLGLKLAEQALTSEPKASGPLEQGLQTPPLKSPMFIIDNSPALSKNSSAGAIEEVHMFNMLKKDSVLSSAKKKKGAFFGSDQFPTINLEQNGLESIQGSHTSFKSLESGGQDEEEDPNEDEAMTTEEYLQQLEGGASSFKLNNSNIN